MIKIVKPVFKCKNLPKRLKEKHVLKKVKNYPQAKHVVSHSGQFVDIMI